MIGHLEPLLTDEQLADVMESLDDIGAELRGCVERMSKEEVAPDE